MTHRSIAVGAVLLVLWGAASVDVANAGSSKNRRTKNNRTKTSAVKTHSAKTSAVKSLSGKKDHAVKKNHTVTPLDTTASTLQSTLQSGAQFEQAGNWGEAIELYEKTLKGFPKGAKKQTQKEQEHKIRYRLRRAKIHFGIIRRCTDASFEQKLLTLSKQDALSLFDTVLQQLQSQYVELRSATSFIAHGTESLYFALENKKFVAKNLRGVDPKKIKALQKILRRDYWNLSIANRAAGNQTISRITNLMQSSVGLRSSSVVMEYIFGGCNALDDYSSVLTPNRLDDLYGNIDGEFVGLGIELKAKAGQGMLLLNVLPNSPAEAGGLKRHESIVAIDGVNCRQMTTDEAAKLLRGESGSIVRLQIQAADSQKLRHGNFVRKAVQVKSFPLVTMVDQKAGIAYIRMTGFQKNSAAELDAALTKLQRQGMRSLIWDVRGNPGGLLDASAEVLDRFIDSGTLVSTRGRVQSQNRTYFARRIGTWGMPLVLLVDGDSASASEIVAGAIRDNRRGTIVGRKTYGKWSVQSLLSLHNGAGFRLTTAKFYSPKGHTYGKIGMQPDVVVDQPSKMITRYRGPLTKQEVAADHDLSRGIQILRQRLVKK